MAASRSPARSFDVAKEDRPGEVSGSQISAHGNEHAKFDDRTCARPCCRSPISPSSLLSPFPFNARPFEVVVVPLTRPYPPDPSSCGVEWCPTDCQHVVRRRTFDATTTPSPARTPPSPILRTAFASDNPFPVVVDGLVVHAERGKDRRVVAVGDKQRDLHHSHVRAPGARSTLTQHPTTSPTRPRLPPRRCSTP